MLENSCQWWLIWCLLFFCHGGAEGQLQWVVKEKVTAYGQNLILFCPIENCCSEPAGWSVGPKAIILDVRTFSNDPKGKYHETYNKDGFGVVIRNLSEADLNVTYRCVYGFNQSTPKYLLHGDVFRENVPDKDKEIDLIAAIVVPIAIMVAIGFIIGIGYCVYRSRTNEETEKINGSDIQMENQQGTNEETEKFNVSDSQMENQQAQPSAQVEPVSGTSGVGPTTFQQAQSAKKKTMKSDNKNEGDVSTIPQESDESDFGDGVVLHVEEDQDAAEEFMTNMRTEYPNLKMISYKNLLPGTSVLESAAKVFDSHIYLFVFITKNFLKAKFEKYCSEIALIETLISQGKSARLIPVKTDEACGLPIVLAPLIPLKYYNYLEDKKLQQGPHQDFIRCFRDLITNGRQKYLKKIVN